MENQTATITPKEAKERSAANKERRGRETDEKKERAAQQSKETFQRGIERVEREKLLEKVVASIKDHSKSKSENRLFTYVDRETLLVHGTSFLVQKALEGTAHELHRRLKEAGWIVGEEKHIDYDATGFMLMVEW